jgi:hypothetical protein
VLRVDSGKASRQPRSSHIQRGTVDSLADRSLQRHASPRLLAILKPIHIFVAVVRRSGIAIARQRAQSSTFGLALCHWHPERTTVATQRKRIDSQCHL